MIALRRRSSPLAILALIAASAALAMTIGAQNAQARPYNQCDLTEAQANIYSKPTYNTFLSSLKLKSTASGTRCKKAYGVLASYHKCRKKNAVTCNKKVRVNWTCTGKKTNTSSPSSFLAKVTCKWGARRVYAEFEQ